MLIAIHIDLSFCFLMERKMFGEFPFIHVNIMNK